MSTISYSVGIACEKIAIEELCKIYPNLSLIKNNKFIKINTNILHNPKYCNRIPLIKESIRKIMIPINDNKKYNISLIDERNKDDNIKQDIIITDENKNYIYGIQLKVNNEYSSSNRINFNNPKILGLTDKKFKKDFLDFKLNIEKLKQKNNWSKNDFTSKNVKLAMGGEDNLYKEIVKICIDFLNRVNISKNDFKKILNICFGNNPYTDIYINPKKKTCTITKIDISALNDKRINANHCKRLCNRIIISIGQISINYRIHTKSTKFENSIALEGQILSHPFKSYLYDI